MDLVNSMSTMAVSAEIAGAPKTDRYEIHSVLGYGASGVVYKAFDLAKSTTVALKSLKFLEGDEIYYLKSEFRSLSSLYHPNLARLFDLDVAEDHCFYTMELVEGLKFDSFVRRAGSEDVEIAFDALRRLLLQLTSGLEFVHQAGKFHRDIKPSNVLVEPGGRLVLLDFGLSIAAQDTQSVMSHTRLFAGTPGYMSPEQLEGRMPAPASDWYSVGAMLYETLTGELPYPVESPVLMYEAQKRPPVPPAKRVPGVPPDLDRLAQVLLDPDPAARAGGDLLRELLTSATEVVRVTSGPVRQIRMESVFVGREAEYARLRKSFLSVCSGSPQVLHVEGISGVGKTSLLEKFVSDMHDEHGALVLRSRCHFQESIRYKAIDGLVDTLSRFLVLQDPSALGALVPRHVTALIKVFPVLERVPFPIPAEMFEPLAADPHITLARAAEALRELLSRLAKHRTVILWIDDLQWSDAASFPLLEDLVAGPDAPGLLIVLSYRSEDIDGEAHLSELVGGHEDSALKPTERIRVPPMSHEETLALIKAVVPDEHIDERLLSRLVHETEGLPIYAIEAAHLTTVPQTLDSHEPSEQFSIADVMGQRIASLAPKHREILEYVALARRPLTEQLLVSLAGAGAEGHEALFLLCHNHLLRKSLTSGESRLETFHDRVRQSVIKSLAPDVQRRRHSEIADGLRASGSDDSLSLVEHYLAAGNQAEAGEFALQAGRAAAERLAFDAAVDLLALALQLRESDPGDWPLVAEYAAALANAGRASDAAHRYLQAASMVRDSRAGDLQIAVHEVRAAEQFLYSGQLDRGLTQLQDVFRTLQLPFPTSPSAALRTSVANRLRFLLHMRRLRPLAPEVIDDEALLRLDTLWIAAKGTVMLDYAIGDAMTSWYLREAVELREPSRALRAIGLEASVFANIGGGWMWRRSAGLMERARSLSEQSEDPYDRAMLQVCDTSIAWFRGQWKRCAQLSEETVSSLRSECVGANFDVAIALGFGLSALAFLGRIRELEQRLPNLLDDAVRRGDRYILNVFRSSFLVFVPLARDEPEEALRLADSTLHDVPRGHFTSLHFHHLIAATNAYLYAGDPARAWLLLEERWNQISKAGFLRLACIGAHLRELRARAAIALARHGAANANGWTREKLLSIASHEARRLRRSALAHAAPISEIISAGVAGERGDRPAEINALGAAASGFERTGMLLHQRAAQIRLAELIAGSKGAELYEEAAQWMDSQGVRQPRNLAAVLTAGPPPPTRL